MPVRLTYPGVYVQELSSTTHVISGVPTAVTAFVDVFERGPVNRPTKIMNFGQFTAIFGALNRSSKASYGIYQFFENGGSAAWVVRLRGKTDAIAAGSTGDIALEAAGPGTWGNRLQVATQPAADGAFDLVVRELSDPSGHSPTVVNVETYAAVTTESDEQNSIGDAIAGQSRLVSMGTLAQPKTSAAGMVPDHATSILNPAVYGSVDAPDFQQGQFTGGQDNFTIDGAQALGSKGDPGSEILATGMYTLGLIAPEIFNILCIPAMASFGRRDWAVAYANATDFCQLMYAFLIVDLPTSEINATDEGDQVHNVLEWWASVPKTGPSDHAAAYFPRIKIRDPITGNPMDTEVSGTLAGIYAETDASRGVWKAPAGLATVLANVSQPVVKINDDDNGTLNQLGINCLRTFAVGTVVWGARTVDGSDLIASQWKYVNVRRLALYIEASLQLGTRWAVFEPNDESLWASLRLSVGAFMNGLYQQGAFAGSSVKDSYFVACDATTTTPLDAQHGRVNINVGFAPLFPAEFVVITISQMISQ